jgi:hypothetical protein
MAAAGGAPNEADEVDELDESSLSVQATKVKAMKARRAVRRLIHSSYAKERPRFEHVESSVPFTTGC